MANAALKEIVPSEREGKALGRVAKSLSAKPGKARLIGPDNRTMIVPESLHAVLVQAVKQLAEGKAVSILPSDAGLTTQQAADLLNVSRPFLIKLLERGEIPFHMTGTHRRIYFKDVASYRERREATASDAIQKLAADAQELGIYDE
jgi:excisionase family DNA binding protein